jgi:hypothetical protein
MFSLFQSAPSNHKIDPKQIALSHYIKLQLKIFEDRLISFYTKQLLTPLYSKGDTVIINTFNPDNYRHGWFQLESNFFPSNSIVSATVKSRALDTLKLWTQLENFFESQTVDKSYDRFILALTQQNHFQNVEDTSLFLLFSEYLDSRKIKWSLPIEYHYKLNFINAIPVKYSFPESILLPYYSDYNI